MKRVLFDENIPRKLRRDLPEFVVRTVQEEGWGSIENGALLRRAESSFDVFVTADRRLQYQQNVSSRQLGVVVIITPALRLQILRNVAEELRRAIATVAPGEVIHVNA